MSEIKSESWIRYKGNLAFKYYDLVEQDSKASIDFLAKCEPVIERKFNSTQFIKDYKRYYYLNDSDDNCPEIIKDENHFFEDVCPKKINEGNQSFKGVEDIFFEGDNSIMNKAEWTETDVLNILAWKTGNINHNGVKKDKKNNNCELDSLIKYKAGWSVGDENKEYSINLGGRSLSGKDYIKFANQIGEIKKIYTGDVDSVWTELKKAGENVKGLGTVYLITLLFFITKGEYPIYDRFAMAALLSLLAEEKGCYLPFNKSIIRKTSLPDKNICNDLSKITLYNTYIGLLYHFFGEEWKSNRDIDRALWVYGHYFDVPQ